MSEKSCKTCYFNTFINCCPSDVIEACKNGICNHYKKITFKLRDEKKEEEEV